MIDPDVQARTVRGYVDGFELGRLSGWAVCDVEPLRIVVSEDGREIAAGQTGHLRHDLGDLSGFSLLVPATGLAAKLLDGRVTVSAQHDSGAVPLPVFEGLKTWLVTHAFVEQIPLLGVEHLRAVLESIQSYLVGDDRDYRVLRLLEGTPLGEMTQVALPVGLVSLDGEAVLGRAGQVFLRRGTNRILWQYETPDHDPEAMDLAKRWIEVFRARRTEIEAAGMRFMQCVIPEKSTVLRELFPIAISDGTAVMRNLEAAISADAGLAAVYLDARRVLSRAELREQAFRSIDTHLAPIGAHAIATEIGRMLGCASPFEGCSFDGVLTAGGDVGRRLLSPYARVSVPAPSAEWARHLDAGLVEVERHEGDEATGSRVVYRNGTAPLRDVRLVAFANSFFDRGEDASQISWWLARLCAEYHVIWRPDLDMDYVSRVQPDVVICQTIERFLPRPAQR